MGRIIIVGSEDDCPKAVDKPIRRSVCQLRDLGGPNKQTNDEFFGQLLQVGGNTTIGAAILATIANGNQDVYIVPIVSYFFGSHFEPEVPGVIFNFGTNGYIASADPQPMRASVMLFHELGHFCQWLLRRQWFEANSQKSSVVDGYFPVIEADNLVCHEWPMCRELGVPSRMHYTDFFNNKEDALKRFTETTKAATTIQSVIRGRTARLGYLKMLAEQGV